MIYSGVVLVQGVKTLKIKVDDRSSRRRRRRDGIGVVAVTVMTSW